MRAKRCLFVSLILGAAVCAATPAGAFAQDKSQKGNDPVLTASASITLTKDIQAEIRSWYSLHPIGNTLGSARRRSQIGNAL